MTVLTPILLAPAAAGLACLLVQSRRLMQAVNGLAFAIAAALGIRLLLRRCWLAARQGMGRLPVRGRAQRLHGAAHLYCVSGQLAVRRALLQPRPGGRGDYAGPGAEFFVLTPLFVAGMFLVVLVNNLGVMWAAVEATALSSVLLVALYNRRTSLEAAWKYVMLGSLGLALALFGTVFVYAAASRKNTEPLPSFNWSHLMSVAPQLDPRLIKLAFVLAFIGYGTKGRPGPDAHLAARAHSGSAVAHQRHAFGRFAQSGALRPCCAFTF